MAIRNIILKGYGNGTFNGTIPLVTTRGYSIGEAATVIVPIGTVAASMYLAGSRQGRLHHSGTQDGDVYRAGTQKGGK